MENINHHTKRKGGRPGKAVKKIVLLGVKCTKIEAFIIRASAQKVQLTVSEYLRELGLTGKIDMRKKALPKEVLQLTATLNHLAANINQIAKKRNGFDELNALERAELSFFSRQLKQLAQEIKNYLQ